MKNKLLFGILVIAFISCAPGVSPDPSNWAKMIFSPSKFEYERACDSGWTLREKKNLGYIAINSSQGKIEFRSGLGWAYYFCGYVSSVSSSKPETPILGSGLVIQDSISPQDTVSVKVELENASGEIIGSIEPTSRSFNEGVYNFGFYMSKLTEDMQKWFKETLALRFKIMRNNKPETYRFTYQEYTALGNEVIR